MIHRCSTILFAFSLISPLAARTWTDKEGRSIEAEMISADDTQVTINKAGKEFKLPLERLSEGDRTFVEEWRKEQEKKAAEQAAAIASGVITFDGKPMTLGGKTNLYEYEYDAGRLEGVRKLQGKDTGYKIAFALPKGFDPSKPQKVFIVSTGVNNDQQGRDGNVGMMKFFGKACTESGWVCMAYDTNIGRSNHDADLLESIEKISSQWPQFKTWEFAVGGFSGGAKASFYPCAYLLKHKYKVTGAFLAGCNADFSAIAQKQYDVPKAAFKDLKVFLGNPTYKAAYAPPVAASLRNNGITNIRTEVHKGKNSLEYEQFALALRWLAGEE